MTLLALTHRALESRRIPHALIGAAALAARGISRATLDIDVLVRTRRCLEPDTWSELAAAAVSIDIRRGDADDPLAGVVRLEATNDRVVDIVVGRARWQADLIARAEPLSIGEVEIPVATAADLVLLKLYAGGPQDRWDVEQLLATEKREAIVASVEQELRALPGRARRLWREIRRE